MSTDNLSNVSHTDAAQAVVEKLRAIRASIPNLVVPTAGRETKRLSSAAAVPQEFIELSVVAVKNNSALTRGSNLAEAEVRDLVAFADAYGPVADEMEALSRFLRHSVTAARNKAGNEALTTYALATRLSKRPETADLKPVVTALRRALGRRGLKGAAETPAPPTPPTHESPK